jgi:hypothetical protein
VPSSPFPTPFFFFLPSSEEKGIEKKKKKRRGPSFIKSFCFVSTLFVVILSEPISH